MDPGWARIALVDAPSVLRWQEWRRVDEKYGLRLVMAGLQGAMAAGAMREQPVKPLAQLIPNAAGPRAARDAVEPAPLEGLRADPSAPKDGLRTRPWRRRPPTGAQAAGARRPPRPARGPVTD
jgi:hypothetical protein